MMNLVFTALVFCSLQIGSYCNDDYLIVTKPSESDILESKGEYEATWESLDKRPVPSWYDDVKFGIFLHWGVYSVPGFGSEWFWSNWKSGDNSSNKFIEETQPPHFTYQTYASQFTAEFFNATQWAKIFKQSGAKYIVLTSKHHEGFTLWPSSRSFGWNSVDIGPRRDIVRELSMAVRKENIHFGVYYSLYEWFDRIYAKDKANNFTTRAYVLDKMLPEIAELVLNYKPDLFWTDGDWEAEDEYFTSKHILAWLYNSSPIKDKVVTYDRWGRNIPCHHGGVYTCTDRFNPQTLQPHKWENCMTVDKHSWGFRKTMNLEDVLSAQELIKQLVTTVSCGGNLLLNVGPTKEGTIAPIFQERLHSIGKWLEVNGEAIYETNPWKFQNDTINNDVWYTTPKNNKNVVYATLLKWPAYNKVLVKSLNFIGSRSTIELLGYPNSLTWSVKNNYVSVELPNLAEIASELAWSLKITNID